MLKSLIGVDPAATISNELFSPMSKTANGFTEPVVNSHELRAWKVDMKLSFCLLCDSILLH